MLLRRLLILGTLLSLSACGGSLGSIDTAATCTAGVTEVARVAVSPASINVLPTGQPFRLVAQAYNGCGDPVSGVNFQWQSTNSGVATVSGDGVVRGGVGAAGTTTISASAVGRAKAAGNASPNALPISPGAAAPGESIVTFVNGTTDNRTVVSISMFPPNPVVANGMQLQMSALAFNRFDQVIPNVSLSWVSNSPNIASVVNSSGLISGNAAGSTTIRVQPNGMGSFGSLVETQIVVRETNGAGPSTPQVVLTSNNLVLITGERGRVFATLRDPDTNTVLAATFTWTPSVTGVVDLVPSAGTDFVNITGVALGSLFLTVTAVSNGVTYTSAPVAISVLNSDPTVSSDWVEVAGLPSSGARGRPGPTTALGLSVSGDYLVATGGVTSQNFTGGPREQVIRSRMHPTGPVFDRDGLQGWDISQNSKFPDELLAPCNIEPACMQINRDDAGLAPQFKRLVRYQVFGHGQVATDTHVYVIGGIDAQVDLGIAGPSGIGAVGPNDTRFSDRTVIAALGTLQPNGSRLADGTIGGWFDGPKMPPVGLASGDTDIPGAYAPGVARYRDWIYVTGGWGSMARVGSGQIIGRNRAEVFRATIRPDGSLGPWHEEVLNPLPQPLNKHRAAVVEVPTTFGTRVFLVVSGGSTGVDQFSLDSVSNQVYFAELDPLSGGFLGIANWQVGTPLPQALEFHAMVNIPGTPTLVVIGGDNIANSSREAYMINLTGNGVTGGWTRLPLLPAPTNPELAGLTTLAAVGVGQVAGVPMKRVYVAGGGQLRAGTDFQLTRSARVYYIDIR